MKTYGVVLAGGKSSRMGCDKAQLMWDGKTLLQHQINLLKEVLTYEDIFISGNRFEFQSINDTYLGGGPLVGLLSVINHFLDKSNQPMRILIVPVDMPLLTVNLLKELLDFDLANLKYHCDLVRFQNHELPIVIRNSIKVKDVIIDLLSKCSNQHSFKSLVKNLKIVELKNNTINNFMNTNTPEEWNEALLTSNHLA